MAHTSRSWAFHYALAIGCTLSLHVQVVEADLSTLDRYHVVRPAVYVDTDVAGHDRRRSEHPLSSRVLRHDTHFGGHPDEDFIHEHAESLTLDLSLQDGRIASFWCDQMTHLYHPEFVLSDGVTESRGRERCQYTCLPFDGIGMPGALTTCDNELHGALMVEGVEHFLEPAHYVDPDQKHHRRAQDNIDHILYPREGSDPDMKPPASLMRDAKKHAEAIRANKIERRNSKETRIVPLEVVCDYAFVQYHQNPEQMCDFYMAASHVIFASDQFPYNYRLSIKKTNLFTNPAGVPQNLPTAGTTGGVQAQSYLRELGQFHRTSSVRSATVVGISGHDLNYDANNPGGSVSGLASLGTLCRSTAAGISEGYRRSFRQGAYDVVNQKQAYSTIAHEIGHNFNADHGCTNLGTACDKKIMNYGQWDKFNGWVDGGFWSDLNVQRIEQTLSRYPFGTCDNEGEPIIKQEVNDQWSPCVDGKQYRSDQCLGSGKEDLCILSTQGPRCRVCGSNTPCPTADDVCKSRDGPTASTNRGSTCRRHTCITCVGNRCRIASTEQAPEGMPCPSGESGSGFCLTVDGEMACRKPPGGTGAPPPPLPPPVQPQPPNNPPGNPPSDPNNPFPFFPFPDDFPFPFDPNPPPPTQPPGTPNPPGRPPRNPPMTPTNFPPQTLPDVEESVQAAVNNLGPIIGAAAGGVVVLAIVIAVVIYLMRKRRIKTLPSPSMKRTRPSMMPSTPEPEPWSTTTVPTTVIQLPAYEPASTQLYPSGPAPSQLYPSRPAPSKALFAHSAPEKVTAPMRPPPPKNRAPQRPPAPSTGGRARPPPSQKPVNHPSNFDKEWDAGSGAWYYVNKITGVSQWEQP